MVRSCSSDQIPSIIEKFPTYREFANADVDEILGERFKRAYHVEAVEFSSCVFINNGESFDSRPLPIEAQFSAVRSILISDYDKDGNKDILLAGNMFESEAETTRADASIGLLLRGTGNMEFESISVVESGFFLPYNIRHLSAITLGDTQSPGIIAASNDDYYPHI